MTRLIGLVGRARAGKDTVGGMLNTVSSEEWHLLSFAAPIKNIAQQVFKFTADQVYGNDKEKPDPRYPRADGTFLTAREAMQKIGTEIGRSCYPNIWVETALTRAAEIMSSPSGLCVGPRNYNVAITDCRFINEAKAIKLAGGQVWRIYRPLVDQVMATHASETEMNLPTMGVLIDRLIYNDGTLEELAERVQEALK